MKLTFTQQLILLLLSYLQITAQVFIVLFVFEDGIKRTPVNYFELSAKFLLVLILLLLLNNVFIYIVQKANLIDIKELTPKQ
jgi:energy-coupling factor transporter transmembrane protein EcfT